MRKFIVERAIPGIGSAGRKELDAVAAIDNRIIAQLWPDIQWLTSFIAEDKSYCIYLAKDEATVRRHSELAGFPADKVSELKATIDPVTPKSGS
ncbi:MAG TPA: DUF4242 domain-containing protein [Kiloniellales bacterium]